MTHRLIALIVIFVNAVVIPGYAECSEEYYINGNPVLLYKTINFWYDCRPEDSSQLCGSVIQCKNKGNVRIQYNDVEMELKLTVEKGFADLLGIFKSCKDCFGPSYLKSTRLNKTYFGSGNAVIPTDKNPAIDSYIFNSMDKAHALRIQSIKDFLGLELEGVVCGLMNGKIALHHAGEWLKDCPLESERHWENYPITIKIVNFKTKEILAEYAVVFDN